MNPVIFREYDIRGVVGKDFDTEFARNLGRAVASEVIDQFGPAPLMTVGYDARLSSPELKDAVAKGISETGARVLILGLVTTPISYFSTFALKDVKGSIMVTGSHNPPEYNGFKISVGPSTIFGNKIQEMKSRILNKKFHTGTGTIDNFDIRPMYIERYKNEFGTLKDIPVVIDCGNGTAGCVVRSLYEAVGLKPTILFEDPDGTFPNHHPDPTVEKNLHDLKHWVKKTNAKIGIGFDGDSDRIGVVDHTGKMILGDELMVLVARDLLRENKGLKIVGDVKCSDRMYSDIEKHGGKPIMWKTGHSLVKEKIKIEKAPFGGELSGHIFFADRNYGFDDALYAGLRLIEILAKTGKTISELLEGLPPAAYTPEIRIDTTEELKVSMVEKIKAAFSKRKDVSLDFTDGIRISFEDGWALARASNTQPVLVLRFEGRNQSAMTRIKQSVEDVIGIDTDKLTSH
jgi:phosphomannomutase/phosphoglucomutase